MRKHAPVLGRRAKRRPCQPWRMPPVPKSHKPPFLIVSLARDCARDAYGHKTPVAKWRATARHGTDPRRVFFPPVRITTAVLFGACPNKIGQLWQVSIATTEGVAETENDVFRGFVAFWCGRPETTKRHAKHATKERDGSGRPKGRPRHDLLCFAWLRDVGRFRMNHTAQNAR